MSYKKIVAVIEKEFVKTIKKNKQQFKEQLYE